MARPKLTRARPFTRYGGPKPEKITTDGAQCGCNTIMPPQRWLTPREKLYNAKAANAMQKFVPGWVPVNDRRLVRGLPDVFNKPGMLDDDSKVRSEIDKALAQEIEREVEGSLEKSFQTWTDVPFFQWHQWFDWNFWVKPSEKTSYLMASANKGMLECEWDLGAAFGHRLGLETPIYSGVDLGWPMAGQHVWLAGRWIFDCGHPPYKSELHPVKALASVRWRGVHFKENGKYYVPGLRFTFFASRNGGYYAYPHLHTGNGAKKKHYKFDLIIPPHPESSRFELVRVVRQDKKKLPPTIEAFWTQTYTAADGKKKYKLRRTRLLMKVVQAPFKKLEKKLDQKYGPPVDGAGKMARAFVPRLQTPRFKDANGRWRANLSRKYDLLDNERVLNKHWEGPPKQVRITIPTNKARDADDFFGVHIDLGWQDDDRLLLAKDVYVYTILFKQIEPLTSATLPKRTVGTVSVSAAGMTAFRFGANGRWFEMSGYWPTKIPLGNKRLVLHLGKDDPLDISCHGHFERKVGTYFRNPNAVKSPLAPVLARPPRVSKYVTNQALDRARVLTTPMTKGWRNVAFHQDLVFGSRAPTSTNEARLEGTRSDSKSVETSAEARKYHYRRRTAATKRLTVMGSEMLNDQNLALGRITEPFLVSQGSRKEKPKLLSEIPFGKFHDFESIAPIMTNTEYPAPLPGTAQYTLHYAIKKERMTTAQAPHEKEYDVEDEPPWFWYADKEE